MPLYIRVIEPQYGFGAIKLFIPCLSANTDAMYRSMPVYLEALYGQRPTMTMPLTVINTFTAGKTRTMPLSLVGDALLVNGFSAHVPLYIAMSGVKGNIPLYASGDGTLAGGLTYRYSIPLFINRRDTPAMIPLYISSPYT